MRHTSCEGSLISKDQFDTLTATFEEVSLYL